MKAVFYKSEDHLVNQLSLPSARSELAPVIIFVYNRLDKLKSCIVSLSNNYLAEITDLFIVSDGPRSCDISAVEAIRGYLRDVTGFRSINVIARPENYGATKSIVSAEIAIGKLYGRVIAMEDDNVVTRNFLDYMNQALDFYELDERIYSVCGYKQPFVLPDKFDEDIWFSPWHNPWTYGTWYNRLTGVNIENNDFSNVFGSTSEKKRLRGFGLFMYDSAWLDWRGFARANDARICMHMFMNSMVSVAPVISLAFNNGQDGNGLHAKKTNRFNVEVSEGMKRRFLFRPYENLDEEVIGLLKRFMDRGIIYRLARFFWLFRAKYIAKRLVSQFKIFH